MKVKLLKDLPGVKAGAITEVTGNMYRFNLETKSSEGFRWGGESYHIDFARTNPDFFEIIEDKPKRWKARVNGTYHYIDSLGRVVDDHDDYSIVDLTHTRRWEILNYFETQEETQKVADKQKMQRELEEYAKEVNDGWVADWSNMYQSKYSIKCYQGKFYIERHELNQQLGVVYFQYPIRVIQAIDKFGDRLKVLLN